MRAPPLTTPHFRRLGPDDGVRAPRRWAFAGALLGLLASATLWAPASWLSQAIQAATQGQVQLQEPRGTVWNGSARLVLTGGADSHDQAALPTRLQWQLRPHWTGARISVQSDCCTAAPMTAQLHAGPGGVSALVDDGQLRLPAELLSGLGTPWNTVALQGQLRLYTLGLQLHYRAGALHNQGRTRLEALAVSSRLSPLRPLGSYRLDLDGGDNTSLALSTLSGDLQLSGQGQWVGSRLHFTGQASANPEHEAALSNLLNILGRRQGARSIITFG
ncbi:general secretion pathway protein GspN [Comamonas phosphati]|nr:general secretion pathway protein GspN [Comamonas phosphati]